MTESKNSAVTLASPKVEKIDFDTWFAMRQDKIARHHRREIIKADFNARGVKECESAKDFDAALEKYGVKLD